MKKYLVLFMLVFGVVACNPNDPTSDGVDEYKELFSKQGSISHTISSNSSNYKFECVDNRQGDNRKYHDIVPIENIMLVDTDTIIVYSRRNTTTKKGQLIQATVLCTVKEDGSREMYDMGMTFKQ